MPESDRTNHDLALVEERKRRRDLQEQERLQAVFKEQENALLEGDVKIQQTPVPDYLMRQYKIDGDKYFFKDGGKNDRLAFLAKDDKLITKQCDKKIVNHMVTIAKCKGWGEIKVSGTKDFKREAWLAGNLEGLKVLGYNATEQDLSDLDKMRQYRKKNSYDNKEKMNAIDKSNKNTGVREYEGILADHGVAHYQFNKDKSKNYFVKLVNEQGEEKIIWGKDFERSIAESDVKNGDRVNLRYENKNHETIGAERNQWNTSLMQTRKDVIESLAKKVLKETNVSEEFKNKTLQKVSQNLEKLLEEKKILPELKVFDKSLPSNKAVIEHKLHKEQTQEKSR